MSRFDFLTQKPFHLSPGNLRWVEGTLDAMSTEEKVGQLFCLHAFTATEEAVDAIFDLMSPGGIMYRPMGLEDSVNMTRMLASRTKVPLLIAANLEKGGNGIATEGTMLSSPMGVAACDDVGMAEKLGLVCGREGAAAGANWAFAPIIDIDLNFRNPITNTRTFGADHHKVALLGEVYVKTVQSCGVAASIKHFPGDGCDERDQHLVTSINDLSCEEWDATYGQVYRQCIEAGALTCMVGHIMQPAWSRRLAPSLTDDEILPATLAPELLRGLLREYLGFNGLICTDATTMAGFTFPMPRSQSVPAAIAAGADMFLFTRNMEEDYTYMLQGVRDGIITPHRLDEAVARILGVKAALKLHDGRTLPTIEEAKKVVGCAQHRQWAEECADKSVTLVKEQPGVLPIDPGKYPRVLYFPIESEQGIGYSVKAGVCEQFRQMMVDRGFAVEVFEPGLGKEGKVQRADSFKQIYDLMIYMANIATKSNQTTVRIEWAQPMGANCPHYLNSVPTIFVSVENPYHLLDVPRIKTFINAYSSTDAVLDAVLDKLMGKSPFKGKSPVDAFCGKWDTRL